MSEEVQVKKDKATGDTIMKKPVRYKRAEPTMQELAAEEELKAREGSTEETTEEVTEEPANAEEASFKKRYGDLRRHAQKVADEKDAELEKVKKQLAEATKKQIKLPKTDEELDAWSAEYPDVARIIETIAIKKSKEMNASIEERLESIAAKEQKSAKQIAEAELLRLHPDFEDIRNDVKFHDWAEEQPQYIQKALYDNETDAKAAARAIDLYKADMGITGKKKAKSTDAAKAVKTKGGSTPSENASSSDIIKESDVARMTSQEYSQNEEAITNAIRSGNFEYDVSGAARQ